MDALIAVTTLIVVGVDAGPYNSRISHGNDSLGQDWFTFCNRPTRSPTDKAYSLESVQKKLNLTFVRCVRCSFGWGTRIGENKKLSLTFVQCSFGWRIRIGENKKLSLTFVRCSFGWRIIIGENKKLSLTFVRCSFGWRTRIGENNKLSQTFVRCLFGWRIRIG